MTPEEAIKRIKNHIEVHSRKEPHFAIRIIEALKMAIAALEKQIPKKPIKYDLSYSGYKCPTCDSNLYQLRSHNIYKTPNCIFCGQALDWSDTE